MSQCLVALLLSACGPEAPGATDPPAPSPLPTVAESPASPIPAGSSASAAAAPARLVEPSGVCGGSDASLPASAAIAALGAPVKEARFTLAEPIPEFRVKLLNHFQLPRDAATAIRERTWSSGDCRLTIWFARRDGGWYPVDQLRWSADDEF